MFLKNHPFAVQAYFKRSVVLTFAFPKEQLQAFLPTCLTLDTFKDKWAFLAVAMVETDHLRPKGFPKFLGNNFFLIGYRIFVRYRNKAGKQLRGLYILKSETNKRKMEIIGNLFTHYNYTTTDIMSDQNMMHIRSKQSNFFVVIERKEECASIPGNSPFTSWKDARKFAGPLPHTFTYLKSKQSMLIIKGVRQNWRPSPINVKDYHFHFFEHMGLNDRVLASAFEIKDIPYRWEKGYIEKWK